MGGGGRGGRGGESVSSLFHSRRLGGRLLLLTGLIAYGIGAMASRRPLFEPLPSRHNTKRKTSTQCVLVFFLVRLEGLEPPAY